MTAKSTTLRMNRASESHSPEHPPASIFVGRSHEIDELHAGLADALAGRGRLFMLVGEPGIGKTRLADELSAYARTQSTQVLWGRCWEGQGAPAFWPWVQIVRSYIHDCEPADLRAEMASGAPAIAQVIADVLPHFPELPVAPPLEPAQARFRFFDSVSTFLKKAAYRRPLVLIFDDLQAADEPSVLLLQFLGREIRDARLLVVGTYRDADVTRDHPLSGSLGAVTRESRCLSLQGLAVQDVARFIERTTGMPPAANLVAAVYERSDGNPLFVSEIVRLLDSEGHLQQSGSAASWSVSIPHGVRETIRRRIRRLSHETNEALTVAAVVGREFGLDVLQQVSGLSNAELLQALDAAMVLRLVAQMPATLGRYRFSHALMRETLYEELSATRRAQLHRSVGEALESLFGTHVQPHPSRRAGRALSTRLGQGPSSGSGQGLAELAYHFFEAARVGGDAGKAIDYARRAGERATTQLAYEEAVALYERALRVAESHGRDEARRCELLLALGDAQWRAGDAAKSKETFQRAAEVARRLGVPEQLARAALGAAPGFGGLAVMSGVVDKVAAELLEEALRSLDDSDSSLRAKVMGRLAMELYYSPSVERRAALSERAVAMARRVADPATLAYALNARHVALWGPLNVEDRVATATEIVRLADEVGDQEMALRGHIWRLTGFLELGDITAVDLEIDASAQLAERLRQPTYLWYPITWKAMRALLEGRFDDAERLAQQALAIGERAHNPDAAQYFGTQVSAMRAEQGRLEEVLEGARWAAEHYPAVPAWRCGLAYIYCALGRAEEARREFEGLAVNDFTDLPRDVDWLIGVVVLSEVCASLGDTRRAAMLYDLLLPYARRCVVIPPAAACSGSASRYLGLLATTMSRFDEASRHFQHALEMNTKLGARLFVAHAQREYAEMLLTRGDSGDGEKAVTLLDEARGTYEELGMRSFAEKAAAALGARGRGSRVASQDTGTTDQRPAAGAPARQPPRSENAFCRDGGYWDIRYEGTTVRVKHNKGLQYVAYLLRHPGREFHVADLMSAADQPADQRHESYARMSRAQLAEQNLYVGNHTDGRALPDARARQQYRRRLQGLKDELEEAERFNDCARATSVRVEIDLITAELAQAYGLGDRSRRSDSIERIRKAVTNRIRDALARIQKAHPTLWGHLTKSVKTGIFCSYAPNGPTSWDV